MKKIKIILTACGCPGASTLIRMLRNNGEREIEIIGTDMDNQAIGRMLCDKFYKVHEGTSKEFIDDMISIIEKEKPDILFPESSNEVLNLARNKEILEKNGTKVLVSDEEAIKTAENKYLMYEKLRKNTDIELPKYFNPKNLDEFLQYSKELGYPEKPVCFKPHVGKGSRGFRIIDDNISRKDLLLNYKPNSRYISMKEFVEIFKNEQEFPNFVLMEYLDGKEMTSDSLCYKGEELLTTVKSVDQARWGVIVKGKLLNKPKIVEQTQKILKQIKMSYNVNIQFINNKLIEINPRVSTFIYQEDLIPPYLAIKLALGEMDFDEIKACKNKIRYGRRMLRYMDQVFWDPGEMK